jgi:hypothetical protein
MKTAVALLLLIWPALASAQTNWTVDSSSVDPMDDRQAVRATLLTFEGTRAQMTLMCTADRSLALLIEPVGGMRPDEAIGTAYGAHIRVRFDKEPPIKGRVVVGEDMEGLVLGQIAGFLTRDRVVRGLLTSETVVFELPLRHATGTTTFHMPSNTHTAIGHLYRTCRTALPT